MKKTSKTFIVGILLCLCFNGYSQYKVNPYPDTLRVKTESQNEIVFSFYRMSDKEEYLADDLWKSMLNVMESAVASSSNQEGIKVTYEKKAIGDGEEEARITVEKLERDADIYLIGKDGMKEIHSDRIDFAIYQPKVSITFSLDDLTDIGEVKELSVESVWDQVRLKFQNEGKRNLYSGKGVFKYGKANLELTDGAPAKIDQLELSAGIGFGFYRDRFAPDLNVRLAVHFPDRLGNEDLKFGLIYSQQYFYHERQEGDFNLDVNGFLSGFVSSRIGTEREIGIALGMLVNKNGDFYKGNTFKLTGFNRSTKSRINYSPELIFTDDFKKVIPAIKFGLSF